MRGCWVSYLSGESGLMPGMGFGMWSLLGVEGGWGLFTR